MCNCYSDWVQNAKNIYNQLYQKQNQLQLPDEELAKFYTLEFLLQNNHCGINNRIRIQEILDFLNSKGINLNRESFQQKVLTALKRDGAVASLIYPGNSGVIFIPCDVSDIEKNVSQVLNRIESELNNTIGLVNLYNNKRINDINSLLNGFLQTLRQGRNTHKI